MVSDVEAMVTRVTQEKSVEEQELFGNMGADGDAASEGGSYATADTLLEGPSLLTRMNDPRVQSVATPSKSILDGDLTGHQVGLGFLKEFISKQ